jgi:UDP-glucose 4-epimerase
MDLTDQKILVTGADGFIGSHLSSVIWFMLSSVVCRLVSAVLCKRVLQ